MSLIESQRGMNRHVPFRDSKLTFLLQVPALAAFQQRVHTQSLHQGIPGRDIVSSTC